MYGKQNRKAFTIIELMVVVSIIALLVAIMVPAVQEAMDIAKDGVVRTQFHALELGLEMFKQDTKLTDSGEYGEYPNDIWTEPPATTGGPPGTPYPGHISLPIQLIGRDLQGYDPNDLYDDTDASYRVGPYIKRESVEFVNIDESGNAYDALPVMLCKWGEPILYFRAKPGSTAENTSREVYVPRDFVSFSLRKARNMPIIGTLKTNHFDDPLFEGGPPDFDFYEKIKNQSLEDTGFGFGELPYRYDSFLLWSAGKDRKYGTEDDVTNFGQ